MHELQITEEIVKIAVEECQKHSINADSILVDVGNMTTYHEEPMMYYFEILKRSIPQLKNSSMVISRVEGSDVRVKGIEDQQVSESGQ